MRKSVILGRALKNIACFTLYYCGLVNLALKFIAANNKYFPITILMYHRITNNAGDEIDNDIAINHPFNNFVKEMKFLKKWFNIISFDDAVDLLKNRTKPGRPAIVITFDDGFSDNYKLAFPVLRDLNIPATIFLTAGLIGSDELPWAERIGEAIMATDKDSIRLGSFFNNAAFDLKGIADKRIAFMSIIKKLKKISGVEIRSLTDEIISKLAPYTKRDVGMLDWQEVKEMAARNISFGAHTMTHPILSKIPFEDAKREICESKQRIEAELNTPIRHFAFPNGGADDFNEGLRQYCKEAGFLSVSTAIYGANAVDSDVYSLKRISPGRNIPVFAVDLIRALSDQAGH